MSLEFYEYEHGVARNRLTTCPLCDHEFAHNEPRWRHFLDEHEPEDAGLAPLGEQPDATGEPLFPDETPVQEGSP